MGRRSKAAGAAFEHAISAACQYYAEQEIAYIEKTPEPFHITGKNSGGVVSGYYEKKGQPDYKGILCDGTGIMFEAKHTDTDRIRQNAVTDAQWESMNLYEKMRGKCFVMVSLGLRKFYRVPWDVWRNMKELYGKKYMTELELERFRLKEFGAVIRILDGIVVSAYGIAGD